jgi:hypothetical protein
VRTVNQVLVIHGLRSSLLTHFMVEYMNDLSRQTQ